MNLGAGALIHLNIDFFPKIFKNTSIEHLAQVVIQYPIEGGVRGESN